MEEWYSKEGDRNLRNAELAKNFADWMYSILKPYIGGTILEVGSGIGTFSGKIVNDFKESRIFLSDVDQKYVSMLDERYSEYDNIQCIKLNLNEPDDYKSIDRGVDTVKKLFSLIHKRQKSLDRPVSSLDVIVAFFDAFLVPAKVYHGSVDINGQSL